MCLVITSNTITKIQNPNLFEYNTHTHTLNTQFFNEYLNKKLLFSLKSYLKKINLCKGF